MAATIPDLHAPRLKLSRRWRPAVLANISLAGLVYVVIPEQITVVSDFIAMLLLISLASHGGGDRVKSTPAFSMS